jgi:CubicO group peptidase (beta-lactamase class C family)
MGGRFRDDGLRRLAAVMQRHVDGGHVPGLVWLLERGGEVHVGAAGSAAIGSRRPIGRDAIFRISSMTKPVTAVATLMCVEDCLVRLDEPVDRLLPELAERRVLEHLDAPLSWTVPADRPITARDLLTFTFGLGVVMAPPGSVPVADAMVDLRLGQGPPDPSVPPDPDEWMRRLGTLPLLHQPGSGWMYGTGSDVLGVLVARAAGMSFERFLAERIFGPLGMVDTGFHVPAEEQDRLVTAYWTDPVDGSLTPMDPPDGRWSRPPAFPSGAGGLVSTVDDYRAFARMLLDGGDSPAGRLLSRASVEVMVADQLTPAQKATGDLHPGWFEHHGWGFGVSMVNRRTTVGPGVGAYGWDGGLGTAWTNDPVEEVVAILLTQAAWSSPVPPPVCDDFRTATYAALADT